jgi:hypothetical protein
MELDAFQLARRPPGQLRKLTDAVYSCRFRAGTSAVVPRPADECIAGEREVPVTVEFWVEMPLVIASVVMAFAAFVVLVVLVIWLVLRDESVS